MCFARRPVSFIIHVSGGVSTVALRYPIYIYENYHDYDAHVECQWRCLAANPTDQMPEFQLNVDSVLRDYSVGKVSRSEHANPLAVQPPRHFPS